MELQNNQPNQMNWLFLFYVKITFLLDGMEAKGSFYIIILSFRTGQLYFIFDLY